MRQSENLLLIFTLLAIFLCINKLEMLKVETKTNHFALKTKLYVNALQSAFKLLEKMNPVQFSA